MLHVFPVNPDAQVHVHAVLPRLGATDLAWLLQCVAEAHCVHVGELMEPSSQVLHVLSVNPVAQVHVHALLSVFEVTDAA